MNQPVRRRSLSPSDIVLAVHLDLKGFSLEFDELRLPHSTHPMKPKNPFSLKLFASF